MTNKPLPELLRKDIFLALVEAQDQEMSPTESRKVVAGRAWLNSIFHPQ
jgi:hypothetical protein